MYKILHHKIYWFNIFYFSLIFATITNSHPSGYSNNFLNSLAHRLGTERHTLCDSSNMVQCPVFCAGT